MAETKVEQITVENWKHFVSIVERATLSVPPALSYIYRGQSDKSWDLIPSFHRHFRPPYLKSEVLLKAK